MTALKTILICAAAKIAVAAPESSNSSELWRADGRCGKNFKMFNGASYECNPKLSGPKKGPCCSGAGYCGDTDSHCTCDTCVDYSKTPDTYPGPWRKDGRCGARYLMSHGAPYQCNPGGDGPRKGPCCSETGFCGNTEAHCLCDDCVDYGKVQEPWRSDGRCGKKFSMFTGKPYQCNPKLSGPRKGPCCSEAGYCGNTEAHCTCDNCVDHSKEGETAGEQKDAGEQEEAGEEAAEIDDSEDAAEPDLEAECQVAAEAGEELHSEYCSLECKHTMCKYPETAATCMDGTIFREMDQAGKDTMLLRHNQLRQKVANGEEENQPAAGNMRKLVWNEELEMIAQRWSDQCVFDHDEVRSKLDGSPAGQNAYLGKSSAEKTKDEVMEGLGAVVDAWYDEVTDPGFSADSIDPYVFSHGIGHYTQVVWAEAEEVGCGMVYYKNGMWYEELIICNYAPGGNVEEGSMYLEGEGCSLCDEGFSCDEEFGGLCARS